MGAEHKEQAEQWLKRAEDELARHESAINPQDAESMRSKADTAATAALASAVLYLADKTGESGTS